jgi:glycerophosphoryl diester phosphodiesterase
MQVAGAGAIGRFTSVGEEGVVAIFKRSRRKQTLEAHGRGGATGAGVRRQRLLAAAVALLVPAAAALAVISEDEPAAVQAPTLVARALLGADATAPGPWPAAPDARPRPAPDAAQPVGSLSGLARLDEDEFLAMPDNGFGAKANSASFLLRVYTLRAAFETADGGEGRVRIQGFVQLRDPQRQVAFPIAMGQTSGRLLTGADFDPESLAVGDDGELWIGDEFGPFILHADRAGVLLEPPIAFPGATSPDNPLLVPGSRPTVPSSGGLEAMARTAGGRLYAVLEKPMAADADKRRRWIAEYDPAGRRWTGRRWTYRVERPEHLVSDLAALDEHRFLAIERDTTEGAEARFKRVFAIDLRRSRPDGALAKRAVLDQLAIRDPAGISLPAGPGDVGLGDPFSMPYVGVESVLALGESRIALVNDTNFESRGRNPARLEDSDLVVIQLPGGALDAR